MSDNMKGQSVSRGNRLHIGIFGRINAGKSTLVNIITGQSTSLVSHVEGTTTDPVYKPMELHGVGPVVFIDTAGFDDEGEIGALRVEKSLKALEKCDHAIYIITDYERDKEYIDIIRKKGIDVILLVRKSPYTSMDKSHLSNLNECNCIDYYIDEDNKNEEIKNVIIDKIKSLNPTVKKPITKNLVKKGSLVVLVMPQDIQAPEGRLILPQVQTIRELLDKRAVTLCLTYESLKDGLSMLSREPDLIITDSQLLEEVYRLKPESTMITSFSVLFAGVKGDMYYFIESAYKLGELKAGSKILICEACTHPPLEEDIGRVKIPNLLKKRIDPALEFTFVRGDDFLSDPSGYDMVIHCGSCMFNRKHVLNRVELCREAGVPMTNYGMVIAFIKGILDKIELPE